MRSVDIELNKIYRLKSSPEYGYIKPVEIFKANNIIEDKKYPHILIKCLHSSCKEMSGLVFIRYFKPREIIKERIILNE